MIARSLSLSKIDGSLVLVQHPVEELHILRGDALQYESTNEVDLNRKLARWPYRSQTFELQTTIRLGEAKQITWKLLPGDNEETLVGYDAASSELFVDRSHCAGAYFSKAFPSKTVAHLRLGSEPLQLHIFVDRSSVELFAQDGEIAMTNLVFPQPKSTGISLTTSGGRRNHVQINFWTLRSIWKQAAE